MQMACQGKLGKMPRNRIEMNALKKIEKLSPWMASKQQGGGGGGGGECGIDPPVPRAEKV